MARLRWSLDGQVHTYDVTANEVTVGRSPENTIQILDPSISRRHAAFERTAQGYRLRDLGSFNGTMIDGANISEFLLSRSNSIVFGRVVAEWLAEEKEIGQGQMGVIVRADDSARQQNVSDARLSVLFELSQLIHAEIEVDKFLPKIVEMLRQVLSADHVYILLRNESTGELEPADKSAGELRISSSLIRHVIENREAVVIDESGAQTFKPGESIVALRIKSAMCAPLWIGERIIGLVYMDSRESGIVFEKKDLDLLLAISHQAAIALERVRLYDTNREAARARDHLQRYMSPQIVEQVLKSGANVTLGGEKKPVTVLFSDIRGFSKFCENHTPEEIVLILNEYFTAMAEVIFRHNGTIDKYIGDAIMAVFGSPISHGNDTENAVRVAYDMRKEMVHLNAFWADGGRRGFEIGIGIHHGEVLAGNIGSLTRMEFTVIGETVNIAARLCEIAGPGEALVGRSVWDAVGASFQGHCVGKKALKGMTTECEVFQLDSL